MSSIILYNNKPLLIVGMIFKLEFDKTFKTEQLRLNNHVEFILETYKLYNLKFIGYLQCRVRKKLKGTILS